MHGVYIFPKKQSTSNWYSNPKSMKIHAGYIRRSGRYQKILDLFFQTNCLPIFYFQQMIRQSSMRENETFNTMSTMLGVSTETLLLLSKECNVPSWTDFVFGFSTFRYEKSLSMHYCLILFMLGSIDLFYSYRAFYVQFCRMFPL